MTKNQVVQAKAEKGFINLAGMPPAKRSKLCHYVNRDAKQFFQFDAFTDVEPGDPIVVPDSDGDALFFGATTELMLGDVSVRVLITPQTTRETAVRALGKIIGTIEGGLTMLGELSTSNFENVDEDFDEDTI